MITYTYGVLPERGEFIAYVTDPNGSVDPEEPGSLFPENGYRLSFGADISFYERFALAINKGIDAHLEAVRFSEHSEGHRDVFTISDPGSMHTLLHRMLEHAYTLECPNGVDCAGDCPAETAEREIRDILYVFGFEWV